MLPIDYHMHTRLSHDSEVPMADYVHAATRLGLQEIAFTDHFDPDQTTLPDPQYLEKLEADFRAVCAMAPAQLKLRCGTEIGFCLTREHLYRPITESPLLDFIIGSVHNLGVDRNIYFMEFDNLTAVKALIDEYLSLAIIHIEQGLFDSLGHLEYPLRYINGRGGHDMSFQPYQAKMQTIMRTLIETGKSIELNTCSLQVGMGEIQYAFLAQYYAMGGRRITVGSDAHAKSQFAREYTKAAQLLKEIGFTEVTGYAKRVPYQLPF